MRAAIAFFAFNRPELTARVFASIRSARPSRLFLVCDGPRADHADDAARCREVRRLLESVDWPCEVERHYADTNMGCRSRVSSGIEWVFSRTAEAIFLEDDTLPDASFFSYCDELLTRYRDDDRVQMICGYNLLGRGDAGGASYWFSAHPRVWGWASWRRAWQGYDVSMRDWPAIKAMPAWTTRTADERRGWAAFLDAVKDGRVDTWDAQLSLLAWRNARLSVIPATNLVANLGFGADSTNTATSVFPGPSVLPMTAALVHPADVVANEPLDAQWVRREFPPHRGRTRRLLDRAFTWLTG